MRRALKKLEAEGLLVRVTDGRGRKGGSTWRASEIALKRIEEEKEAKTIRRDEPKTGRNDPCKCGSGKKYKRCCLQRTTP